MSLPRQSFTGRRAGLDFSMEMPVGFYQPELPADEVDFADPTKSAPLMLTASPIALALITVAARPAYDDGAVSQWLEYLCGHFGITLTARGPGFVGGLLHRHPAVVAQGVQVQDGVELAMRLVMFEDGGRLVTAHAMCPKEIEDSYMSTLLYCIMTVELAEPQGPTVALEPGGQVPTLDVIAHDPGLPPPRDAGEVYEREMAGRRAEAAAEALPLIEAGRFDEAEAVMKAADGSIMGDVELGRMYTGALQAVLAGGARRGDKTAEALFERALHWKLRAYPDAHTEVEAEQYEQGQREDRAELIKMMGYDPGR